MKIHTNVIKINEIYDALTEQIRLGRIASHVIFKVLAHRGSRTHDFAFEVQLEAFERDCGRRAGNSGAYGAMRPEVDGYAATHDEWGWLLAALYRIDPDMIVGTPKSPVYADAEHFHDKTAWSYDPERWLKFVNQKPALADESDPYPIITGRASKTKRGYFLGRRGADRHAAGSRPTYWPGVLRPRTVAEVEAFAYPLGIKS